VSFTGSSLAMMFVGFDVRMSSFVSESECVHVFVPVSVLFVCLLVCFMSVCLLVCL
jgi:hypothetical protein